MSVPPARRATLRGRRTVGTSAVPRSRRLKSTSPLRFDEIAAPSGGPWGSTYVDKQFENFVEALIGRQNYATYKASPYWIDMLEAWEKVKVRAAHPSISRARGRRCHLLSRPRAP